MGVLERVQACADAALDPTLYLIGSNIVFRGKQSPHLRRYVRFSVAGVNTSVGL